MWRNMRSFGKRQAFLPKRLPGRPMRMPKGTRLIAGSSHPPVSYTHLDVYKRQLLFYGNVILPFVDHFPRDTELYRLLTTRPSEVRKEAKACLLYTSRCV